MRLVLIENKENMVSYAVYEGKVEVAEFHLETGGILLSPRDVEEMRLANYASA